ncbi:MAG: PH domain-containing protein [Bacilli bacterium]
MKEKFKDILDKDEEIIKVFKPNKKRFVNFKIIVTVIWFALFALIFLAPAIAALAGAMNMVDDSGVDGTLPFGIVFLVLGVFNLIFLAFSIVYIKVTYKKTFYAYTNKRVIIRQGFIGVDFLTLDMKTISTVLVNVGLLDKLITPNTGTIRFGSSATPIGAAANGKSGFGIPFANVDDAYVTYREIKEIIDTHRSKEEE